MIPFTNHMILGKSGLYQSTIYTTYSTTWNNITVPAGASTVIIEAIGGGGIGVGSYDPETDYFDLTSGAGGAYAKVTKTLTSLGSPTTLEYRVGGSYGEIDSEVRLVGGATIVKAQTASYSTGIQGQAFNCIGDIKYNGGAGIFANVTGVNNYTIRYGINGGSAGGPLGAGTSGNISQSPASYNPPPAGPGAPAGGGGGANSTAVYSGSLTGIYTDLRGKDYGGGGGVFVDLGGSIYATGILANGYIKVEFIG